MAKIGLPHRLYGGVIHAVADPCQRQGAREHDNEIVRRIFERAFAIEFRDGTVRAVNAENRLKAFQLPQPGSNGGTRLSLVGMKKLDGGRRPQRGAVPAHWLGMVSSRLQQQRQTGGSGNESDKTAACHDGRHIKSATSIQMIPARLVRLNCHTQKRSHPKKQYRFTSCFKHTGKRYNENPESGARKGDGRASPHRIITAFLKICTLHWACLKGTTQCMKCSINSGESVTTRIAGGLR